MIVFFSFRKYTAFAIAGSKLTQRIRLKTFACLLRQEIAYFDRPENSSGAISVRLSSGIAALEQMIGTRLGVICETLALSCFGLLFGSFFSWQLTMIVFIALFIIGLTTYLNVRWSKNLNKQSDLILQRANTVRSS
jgi:ATP-binding cassette subfamily B (MDR/TAP) protein 1